MSSISEKLYVTKKTIYLMDIYDKSYQSSISDKELKLLIKLLSEWD